MRTIQVLVVDDERYAREELTYLLEQHQHIKVIGEVERGQEAIVQALQLQPDVVFLDIDMPKMNGIEVAKALLELKKVPIIVFATAYPQFAAEAFRINAIDYLLKPYNPNQLSQTIERIHKQLKPDITTTQSYNTLGKLAVEKDGEIDYIFIKDILYMYPEGKVSKIVTKKTSYEVKSSLKDLENRLATYNFFRVHRSYLVNLNYVTRLTPWFNGAYELELEGETEKIPVSRNYAKELQNRLDL